MDRRAWIYTRFLPLNDNAVNIHHAPLEAFDLGMEGDGADGVEGDGTEGDDDEEGDVEGVYDSSQTTQRKRTK